MPSSDRNNRALPWGWRDWATLVLLGLGTGFALWWYWGRSPHLYSDTTMAIYRAFEVDRSISQRVLYPRLAMDFNFTYGAPLLEYRPPLVHYVIPAFHWAGLSWITAAKATATLELFLAGVGMYVYGRWLFGDRRAALVSAAAYMFAPYLLTDINERGAIGEAAALALLPWLFWAMHRVLREEGYFWPWLGALFTALLILAHNIVAFFAIPILLLYLGLLAWREGVWRPMVPMLSALALGLALSAFYWMPAFFERDYAQIASHMLGEWPEARLSTLGEWIQRQLAFDYWGPLHFRLSLWQAVILAVAVLAIAVWGDSKRLRTNMVLLAGITVGAMLLQLEWSSPFWDNVPLVGFIQFPWRLLGVAAFCIALLAGYLFTPLKRTFRWPHLARTGEWIATTGLVAIVLYAGTRTLAPQFYHPWTDALSQDAISLEGLFERGRSIFTIFSDFLPVGVKVDTWDLVTPRLASNATLPPMTYVPSISVAGDRPFRTDLQVRADQPFQFRFHRFYFPGWQVYVSGKPVATGPSGDLGLVTADLPSGEYPVVVQFGQTPVRSLADIVTLASFLAWMVAGIVIHRARPVMVTLVGALVLVAALLLAQHGTGEPPRRPIAYAANFHDEIHLLGYHLPDKLWRPGDDLSLVLYWLASRTPTADYKIFIHLVTLDDSARVAQGDSLPIRGFSPTTRWEPGEIIVDEHLFRLDENVPPGKYLLLIGLYQPETVQNLPVSGAARVLPGNRVVLTEIEVQAR